MTYTQVDEKNPTLWREDREKTGIIKEIISLKKRYLTNKEIVERLRLCEATISKYLRRFSPTYSLLKLVRLKKIKLRRKPLYI